MMPRSRRILVTATIALVSGALLSVIFFTPKGGSGSKPVATPEVAIEDTQPPVIEDGSENPTGENDSDTPDSPSP
ncbi:MAG: hypothetical protein O7G85_01470, partial [Planctomycetota bacterium]|nr:hypothetical protein [Planctomycetota bacterium]